MTVLNLDSPPDTQKYMNSSDAMEILKNFRNQRVLVMGGVTPDRHLWGTLTRMSPEASPPHRCQATHRLFAGRRGNEAATDAALSNLSS
jgi:bifunctional ADP-heptose synthase (sugar kinase/adenylyltransferase)